VTICIKPVARLEACLALILNAGYRALSDFPLVIRRWQGVVRAAFKGQSGIVSDYDKAVRSPRFKARLPSAISPRASVPPLRHSPLRFDGGQIARRNPGLATHIRLLPIQYTRIMIRGLTLAPDNLRPSFQRMFHHIPIARQDRAPELGVLI
jgi:hypothetical protein